MHASNGNGKNDFLGIPARSPKPRTAGLTHVIDKGMNLRDIEGMFDTAGEFVDIVKLGWGTSYVTQNLEKKIALYRSFETPVVCGGTLFEAAIARGKLDEYRRWLRTTASRTSRSRTGRSSSSTSASSSTSPSWRRTSSSSPRSAPRTRTSSSRRTSGSSGCRPSSRPARGR